MNSSNSWFKQQRKALAVARRSALPFACEEPASDAVQAVESAVGAVETYLLAKRIETFSYEFEAGGEFVEPSGV